MIKPRTIFVLFIIVLIQVYLFLPWKGIFFILLSILFIVYLVLCSANICSQAYIKTLCKGNTKEKKIAISFDDGPNTEITPKVLDILDKYNAKAGFFCIGKHVESNTDLLRLMDQKGHVIGNHTFSHHRWFDLFSSKKMKTEIEKTNKLIEKAIGKKTKLFRPPYGITNPNLRKAIAGLNFHTIGWSVRSLDTVKTVEQTFNKVTKDLSPGDIVLFHDNREHITDILELFLEYTQKNNFEIVSPDQILDIEAYEK